MLIEESTRSKKCATCKNWKLVELFYRRKSKKDGRRDSCKLCENNEKQLNRNLLRQYKISYKDYTELCKLQNYKCKICNKEETAIEPKTNKIRRLAVDHCHDNGTVRGLLCSRCNTGIGLFKDNIHNLSEAIKYLKKYKTV